MVYSRSARRGFMLLLGILLCSLLPAAAPSVVAQPVLPLPLPRPALQTPAAVPVALPDSTSIVVDSPAFTQLATTAERDHLPVFNPLAATPFVTQDNSARTPVFDLAVGRDATTLHAVFLDGVGPNPGIYYTTSPTLTLGPAHTTRISAILPRTAGHYAQIAVDAADGVHVVWTEPQTSDGGTPVPTYRSWLKYWYCPSACTSAANWSAVQEIGLENCNLLHPVIAVDGAGTTLAVAFGATKLSQGTYDFKLYSRAPSTAAFQEVTSSMGGWDRWSKQSNVATIRIAPSGGQRRVHVALYHATHATGTSGSTIAYGTADLGSSTLTTQPVSAAVTAPAAIPLEHNGHFRPGIGLTVAASADGGSTLHMVWPTATASVAALHCALPCTTPPTAISLATALNAHDPTAVVVTDVRADAFPDGRVMVLWRAQGPNLLPTTPSVTASAMSINLAVWHPAHGWRGPIPVHRTAFRKGTSLPDMDVVDLQLLHQAGNLPLVAWNRLDAATPTSYFHLEVVPLGVPADQFQGKCACEAGSQIQAIKGDPVNTHTGAFYLQATDLSVPTNGPPLVVERAYVSQFTAFDQVNNLMWRMAPGWRSSLLESLRDIQTYGMDRTPVVYEAASGNRLRFFWTVAPTSGVKPSQALQPASGVHAALVYNAEASLFTLTLTDGTTKVFDMAGRLVSRRDPQGHEQTVTTIQESPLILRITDVTSTRSLTATFINPRAGSENVLQRIQDDAGRTVVYTYDPNGNLSTVTDVRGGVTTYTYEPGTALLKTITDPMGVVQVTNTYQNGRVIQQVDAVGVTTTYATVSSTLGLTSTVTLTKNGMVLDQTRDHYRPDGTLQFQARAGKLQQYTTFDAALTPGQMINGNGSVTRIESTAAGIPRQITDPTSVTTTISSTLDHRPIFIAAGGITTTLGYGAGRTVTQTTILGANGAAVTTQYTYTNDLNHWLLEERRPDGVITHYDRHPTTGQVLTMTVGLSTPLALRTTYQYDALGRVTHTTVGAGTPEATTTVVGYTADHQIAWQIQNYNGSGVANPARPSENVTTTHRYDVLGRRSWTQTPDGRYRQVTRYDAQGRVVWVVDNYTTTSGQPLQPPTDAQGRVTSLPAFSPTLPDANVATLYGYDALGRTEFVTRTGVLTGAFDPTTRTFASHTTRTTHTQYDDQSRPLTVTENYQAGIGGNLPDVNVQTSTRYDGAGRVIATSDALGQQTRYGYDAAGRVVTTTLRYDDGNPLTGVDTDFMTVTRYDADGRVARTITNYVDGVFVPTEPLTDQITMPTYDSLGRVVSQTQNVAPGQTRPDVNLTTATRYDGVTGRVVATQDPLGRWSVPQYDALGQTTHTILNCRDALGNPAWTGCVNPSNRPDRSIPTSTSGGYDGLGRATTRTTNLGVVTKTQFDGLGRVITTTQNYVANAPTSAITNVQSLTQYHDSMGTRVTQIDPLGATTHTQADALGRTVVMTDAAGLVTRNGYDGLGTLRWSMAPNGTLTVYRTDGLGRVVTTTANYQNGVHAPTEAVDQDVVTQTVYDRADRTVARIDPGNHRIEFGYDRRGLLTSVQEHVLMSGCTTARTDCNVLTQYQYDRMGHRTAIIDANGNVRRFTYDAAGRQTSAIDAAGVVTTWDYDGLGRQTRTHDPRGTTYDVIHHYDELDRITQTLTLDTQTLTPITWQYDRAGRRTQMVDGVGTTIYTYDRLSRVTSVATSGIGTVGYGYSARGERTSLTYPDGSVVAYTYTPSGQMDTVTQGSTVLADYDYHATSGQVLRVTQPHPRVVTTYGYDALMRTTAITHTQDSRVLEAFSYGFNQTGQISTTTEVVQTPTITALTAGSSALTSDPYPLPQTAATPTSSGPLDHHVYLPMLRKPGTTWHATTTTTQYTYDGLGRLTETLDGNIPTTTTYDRVGNRLTMTQNGVLQQSFTYTARNQVQGWSYDAAGNLLSDGSQTYGWDALGRLTRVTPNGQSASTYAYNGDGVLVKAWEGATPTTYVQDTQGGLSQILQQAVAGVPTTYQYGLERLTSVTNANRTWTYHDRLGSVRLTLDNGGTPTTAQDYDAWGVPTAGTPQPFGFTGELQSSTTGLQYLRARWYNPATGTLLGRDPFAGYAEQPYSLHPYAYAASQPTLLTDPSGRCYGPVAWLRDIEAMNCHNVDNSIRVIANPDQYAGDQLTLAYTFLGTWATAHFVILAAAGIVGWTVGSGLSAAFINWAGPYVLHAGIILSEYTFTTALATSALTGASFVSTNLYQQMLDGEPIDWGEAANAGMTGFDLCLSIFMLPFGMGLSPAMMADDLEPLPMPRGTGSVDAIDDAGRVAPPRPRQMAPGPCSFTAETPVTTKDGPRPIAALKDGDSVLAYDEMTGETGLFSVTAVFSHTDPVVVDLTLDGAGLTTTPEHPFYTQDSGWVAAGLLDVGDQVWTADRAWGTVDSIRSRADAQVMWNLTVDTAHTFFVGDGQWLVHNECAERIPDVVKKYGGIWVDHDKIEFPSRDIARQAASEIAGNLGSTPIAIRAKDYRGAPYTWQDSEMIIGRASADNSVGWRDDHLGHSFPKDGVVMGPHVNVWAPDIEHLQLYYPDNRPK